MGITIRPRKRNADFFVPLASQIIGSASTFLLILGLGSIIEPKEFGKFALYWAWYLVALSLSRALVAEVVVIQPGADVSWGFSAFRANVLLSLGLSAILGSLIYFIYGDASVSVAFFLSAWFGCIQDFGRYYTLKLNRKSSIVLFELINLTLFGILLSTAMIYRLSMPPIWWLLAVSNFVAAIVFNFYSTRKPSKPQSFWSRARRAQGISFALDSLVGALFNLWVSSQIFHLLDPSDLGTYRYLVTYFGISSLLANFAKSGFSAGASSAGTVNRNTKLLLLLMVSAPLLQYLALVAFAAAGDSSFGLLSESVKYAPLAALSRLVASVSALTLVIARVGGVSPFWIWLGRALSLTPGFAVCSLFIVYFGISGAFILDLLNYSLMAVVPIAIGVVQKKKMLP